MLTLSELQSRYAQAGRVEALYLRPARGEDTVSVDAVEVSEAGLKGDRARKGKRSVTLIQAEHVPVIQSLAGLSSLDPGLLRRNIVVAGLNLLAFRGKRLTLGSVKVELTVPCHPCSKMETLLGHGGYTAMRGHGGMCASVLSGGPLAVGMSVTPNE